jgi:hypothetical protein
MAGAHIALPISGAKLAAFVRARAPNLIRWLRADAGIGLEF